MTIHDEINDETTNSGGGFHSLEDGLDCGEDCAMAILLCIQSFFNHDVQEEGHCRKGGWDWESSYSVGESADGAVDHQCTIMLSKDKGESSSLSLLAREIGLAMGGALVARLVQGCLSLLPQESLINNCGDKCGKSQRKENAALQLEALKTLRTFMEGISLVNLWRSILPGCFAVSCR